MRYEHEVENLATLKQNVRGFLESVSSTEAAELLASTRSSDNITSMTTELISLIFKESPAGQEILSMLQAGLARIVSRSNRPTAKKAKRVSKKEKKCALVCVHHEGFFVSAPSK